MRKLSLGEQKSIQLEILDSIHRFCESEGLMYSLCGGTMLGAVRHRGYIPWDDDIDLMMPRTDYQRFLDTYSSKENEVLNLSEKETCTEQFAKVSRRGTTLEDATFHRRLWGVNVDIFPIDGMPSAYRTYTDRIIMIHNKVMKCCPAFKAAGKNKAYWCLRYYAKRIFHGVKGNCLSLKAEINQTLCSNLPEESPLSTVIAGDYKIFPFPSDTFRRYKDILFEGKKYKCIMDTDLYLSTVYGDYMTLPPESERVTHHIYKAFIEG